MCTIYARREHKIHSHFLEAATVPRELTVAQVGSAIFSRGRWRDTPVGMAARSMLLLLKEIAIPYVVLPMPTRALK
jgi:hypothetical protein